MQPLIEFLNALFAPLAATPSMPLDIRPPAIHREAPRVKRIAIPMPKPFPTCALASRDQLMVAHARERDPLLTFGAHCKPSKNPNNFVG